MIIVPGFVTSGLELWEGRACGEVQAARWCDDSVHATDECQQWLKAIRVLRADVHCIRLNSNRDTCTHSVVH